MEIVFNIDCKKTEDALKGMSCLAGKTISAILKEFTDINGILMACAKGIKEEGPEYEKRTRAKYGDKPLDDLFRILS